MTRRRQRANAASKVSHDQRSSSRNVFAHDSNRFGVARALDQRVTAHQEPQHVWLASARQAQRHKTNDKRALTASGVKENEPRSAALASGLKTSTSNGCRCSASWSDATQAPRASPRNTGANVCARNRSAHDVDDDTTHIERQTRAPRADAVVERGSRPVKAATLNDALDLIRRRRGALLRDNDWFRRRSRRCRRCRRLAARCRIACRRWRRASGGNRRRRNGDKVQGRLVDELADDGARQRLGEAAAKRRVAERVLVVGVVEQHWHDVCGGKLGHQTGEQRVDVDDAPPKDELRRQARCAASSPGSIGETTRTQTKRRRRSTRAQAASAIVDEKVDFGVLRSDFVDATTAI